MMRWRSLRLVHRPSQLDTAQHVAAHPVGTGQVHAPRACPRQSKKPGRAPKSDQSSSAHGCLSVRPGTCAGSMQAPRTIKSICTPRAPASIRAGNQHLIGQRIHLEHNRGHPCPWQPPLAGLANPFQHVAVQMKRAPAPTAATQAGGCGWKGGGTPHPCLR